MRGITTGKARAYYIALLALALAALAGAQAVSGLLLGTVTDPSGAAVAGATVTAKNLDTNVTTSTATNGSD